jgi:phytoene desaturase
MSSKKAIVIGSGIGGLAIAIRLSLKGYKVTVFETNSHVGGKVSWIEKDGFKWGFGASLLTLPELIDDLFILAGKNPNDYYEYIQLNPITQYFYPDGTCINAYADREQFAAEIENKTTDKKEVVLKYLDNIQYLFNLTEKTFLHSSLHKVKTYLSLQAAKIAIISPFKLGLFTTVNKKLTQTFTDPKTIQLFNRYATYNGSDPFRAPAVLNIIAHPEFNKGAYILKDGMPSLTQNMYKLAKELGVDFKLNHKVDKILLQENQANGVQSNGQALRQIL